MADDLPVPEDGEPETRTVRVTCTWQSSHEIEVPADWEMPSSLDGFPAGALEEMKPLTAELIDWS
jgi:hypothetical protein